MYAVTSHQYRSAASLVQSQNPHPQPLTPYEARTVFRVVENVGRSLTSLWLVLK